MSVVLADASEDPRNPFWERTLAASVWPPMVYKKVNTTTAPSWELCELICWLDDGPCYMFSIGVSEQMCYMGAWHVDSDVSLITTTTRRFRQRRRK